MRGVRAVSVRAQQYPRKSSWPPPSVGLQISDLVGDPFIHEESDEDTIPISVEASDLLSKALRDCTYPNASVQDRHESDSVVMHHVKRWLSFHSGDTWAGQTHFCMNDISVAIIVGNIYKYRGLLPAPHETKLLPRQNPSHYILHACEKLALSLTTAPGSNFPKVPSKTSRLYHEHLAKRRYAVKKLHKQVSGIWKVVCGMQAQADNRHHLRIVSEKNDYKMRAEVAERKVAYLERQLDRYIENDNNGQVARGPIPTPLLDADAGQGPKNKSAGTNNRRNSAAAASSAAAEEYEDAATTTTTTPRINTSQKKGGKRSRDDDELFDELFDTPSQQRRVTTTTATTASRPDVPDDYMVAQATPTLPRGGRG